MRRSPFLPVQPSGYAIKKNNEVRQKLTTQGDDGSKPRQVVHFFKSRAATGKAQLKASGQFSQSSQVGQGGAAGDRHLAPEWGEVGQTSGNPPFADVLRQHGFSVTVSEFSDQLTAMEVREVASGDFDSLTQALCELGGRYGWAYEGFECVVETGADTRDAGWTPLRMLRRLSRRKP